MRVKLADKAPAFATRPRARSIVQPLPPRRGVEPFVLDLSGVQAASPSFLDELFGQLADKYGTVTISGARPELHPLIDRVIARRGLESRFRVTAEA